MTTPSILPQLAELLPEPLMHRSGSALYSGRSAFTAPRPLYLLGLNPGGDPDALQGGDLAGDLAWILREAPGNWSRYRDEEWGAPAGTSPLQRRVLHLLKGLGMDPGLVPSSNLVFPRSQVEARIAHELGALVELCWPFHQAGIEQLGVRTIVCFGRSVADEVRRRTGAHHEWGQLVEANGRRWTSRGFEAPSGMTVVQVTHPGRADWTVPATDVTPLVREALERAGQPR